MVNNRLTDLSVHPCIFLSRSTRSHLAIVSRRPSFDNQSISLVLQATLAVYFEKLASALTETANVFWCVLYLFCCIHHRHGNRAKDSAPCRDEPSKELRTLKSQHLNISCHDPAASDASSKTRTVSSVSLGMWCTKCTFALVSPWGHDQLWPTPVCGVRGVIGGKCSIQFKYSLSTFHFDVFNIFLFHWLFLTFQHPAENEEGWDGCCHEALGFKWFWFFQFFLSYKNNMPSVLSNSKVRTSIKT